MPTLLVAIVLLMLWLVLAFVAPVPSGMVHALLPVSVTLLVRWWALRS